MIFAFMEYAESEYYTYLYTGRTAVYIMDEEARERFWSMRTGFIQILLCRTIPILRKFSAGQRIGLYRRIRKN